MPDGVRNILDSSSQIWRHVEHVAYHETIVKVSLIYTRGDRNYFLASVGSDDKSGKTCRYISVKCMYQQSLSLSLSLLRCLELASSISHLHSLTSPTPLPPKYSTISGPSLSITRPIDAAVAFADQLRDTRYRVASFLHRTHATIVCLHLAVPSARPRGRCLHTSPF
jgi:hypothetical protein